VSWRCYARDGSVYFVSETTMLQQKPSLVVSEDVLGVDGVDFDVDNGQDSSDATITARASRWAVPAGLVAELYDCGPADGRWIVRDVQRSLFDPEATISLKRVTVPLPEPAASTSSAVADTSQPFGTTPGLGLAGGDPVARAYAAAQAMDAKKYPYVWGGGHAHVGTPDGGVSGGEGGGIGLIGYDCSGSTCAILGAAEMGYTLGDPADVSGTIAARWGLPGKGIKMTVYANSVHVFIVFHTPGGDQHFGTGMWGKSWDGPGFNPNMHPLDGFTPRHWKDEESTGGTEVTGPPAPEPTLG